MLGIEIMQAQDKKEFSSSELDPDALEACGSTINAVDPAELDAPYGKAGLPCSSDMGRLAPFMPTVADNWRRGMRSGGSLMRFATWEDPESGDRSFVGSWKTTHSGWNTPCAVCAGDPASDPVLLAAVSIHSQRRKEDDRSQQYWFQTTNRFSNKVFDHIGRKLGPDRASVEHYSYIAMPMKITPPHDDDLIVIPCRNNVSGRQDDLIHLVTGTRGLVYVESEELDHEDLNLDAVDDAYRRVGLRRFRRVWVVYSKVRRDTVGAAIAYRGPLGFDLRFLENRCDIIVHPMLSEQATDSVVRLRMAAAAPVYDGFTPGIIPVITDERTGALIDGSRGERIRDYAQAVILSSAYEDWYRHVARIHDRIPAGKRRGLAVQEGDSQTRTESVPVAA